MIIIQKFDCIHIEIISSEIGVKTCVITAGIKKYQSTIKNFFLKKDDKIVLLAKSNLNNIELLISKDLIDSNIGDDEFVLVKNELEEFYDIKKEIKNSNYK